MGRHRTHDFELPPGVFRRGERFYFGKAGVALGGASEWFRRYAELRDGAPPVGTLADAAAAYQRDELPRKARKTQSEYTRQLTTLVKVFGHMPLDAIAPADVKDFLGLRPRIAGTREKALLSAVFNFARGARLTSAMNPCIGIRGHKATRTRYVEDAEFTATVARADAVLADFLRLCYRSGQRPSDVLRICPAHAKNGRLHVQQGKTGAKVRIRLAGPLATVFKRLAKGRGALQPIVRNEAGQPMTLAALRKRFDRLEVDWQIRDLRAKAATDLPDVQAARGLLGHTLDSTTDGYRRSRSGGNAEPVMRRISDKRRK